jgi:hypothetical protein
LPGPPSGSSQYARTLPAAAATLRLRSELDWLQVVREALHGMVGEAPGAADPSANGSPALRAGNAD